MKNIINNEFNIRVFGQTEKNKTEYIINTG